MQYVNSADIIGLEAAMKNVKKFEAGVEHET